MSNMSFIEKLLVGVEVQWKTLKKVTTSTKNIKWQEVSSTYRYIDLTSVCRKRKSIVGFTEISTKNAPSRAKKLIEENDVIFATTRPTQQRFTLVNHEYSGEIASTGYCILRAKLDEVLPKWILYNISSAEFNHYVEEHQSGAAYPAISDSKVKEFKIPVPPLDIQAEIIRILDSFTELTLDLTTELTSELTARKKQYYYYRDLMILNSDSKTEKLDDIADIYLGLTYTPTYVDEGVKFISAKNTSKDFLDLENVKYISEDEYQKSTSNAKPKRGDVLFTRVGSNLGHPVIVDTDEQLCMFVSLGFIRVNPKKVLNSYIKHWMNTDLFWAQVRKYVHGAAKVNLNTGWLKKFDVLVPSITEQKRIVAILDKYDVLTKSISEDLPREIKLRQKQYEYYLDLLLSFPKPEVDA